MTARRVLMDTIGRETRRVVIENGAPVELAYAYAAEQPRLVGSLFLGRVERVLPGMNAAFVDIGLEKNAFLSMDDVPAAARALGIGGCKAAPVKGGQAVIVQVVKEPGGDKGPRVSMNPSLPGQCCVLLPTVDAVGVSRHIQDETRRAALEALGRAHVPAGMGVVLRTAAEDADDEEIAQEIQALAALWISLSEAAAAQRPPAPIWYEGDLPQRTRRDFAVPIEEGPFDDALETALDKLLRRKVWLKSGGYLVVDHTEAMTVIDVNSGKNTGGRSQADTMRALNIEAAREVARQLRMRDAGGIVIIDFVDMRTEEDRQSVLSAFADALADDRAKRHIHGFTGAGLLELTRRPVWQPVHLATMAPCAGCEGGWAQSPQAAAHALLRQVRRRRMSGETDEVQLDTAPAVAAVLEEIGLPPGVRLRRVRGFEGAIL